MVPGNAVSDAMIGVPEQTGGGGGAGGSVGGGGGGGGGGGCELDALEVAGCEEVALLEAGGLVAGGGGRVGTPGGAVAGLVACAIDVPTETEIATGSLIAPDALYARTTIVCVPGVAFQV